MKNKLFLLFACLLAWNGAGFAMVPEAYLDYDPAEHISIDPKTTTDNQAIQTFNAYNKAQKEFNRQVGEACQKEKKVYEEATALLQEKTDQMQMTPWKATATFLELGLIVALPYIAHNWQHISNQISNLILRFKPKKQSPAPVTDNFPKLLDYAGMVPSDIQDLADMIKKCPNITNKSSKEEIEANQRIRSQLPKSILFYGPPGTGKTYLAKCLASELGVPFEYADYGHLGSMWMSKTSENVNNLFAQARTNARNNPKKIALVFIDEIDGLLAKRSSNTEEPGSKENNRTVSTFLTNLDGLRSTSDCTIILVGATNLKDNLDPAFLRSGRCEWQIELPLPSEQEIKKYFAFYLEKSGFESDSSIYNAYINSLDTNKIAGLTPADIAALSINVARTKTIAQARNQDFNWQISLNQALDNLQKNKQVKKP